MPNCILPQEILDFIVDFLRDDVATLQACCLVSKSWVSRARKHLFSIIQFQTPEDIEVWKTAFPNTSNSPARYTRTLSLNCLEVVTVEDVAEGGWLSSFSRVEYLELDNYLKFTKDGLKVAKVSLAPYRKFAPTLKKLLIASFFFLRSQAFDLIRSLPLLEDLTLIGHDVLPDGAYEADEPAVSHPVSPALSGTLQLLLFGGMARSVPKLLDLPNGLHFHTLKMSWCEEGDVFYIVKLLEACSGRLERLDVTYQVKDDSIIPGVMDLSKAMKLKDLVFQCEPLACGWITRALGTISSQHQDLQRMAIHIPSVLEETTAQDCATAETLVKNASPGMRWSDLDRALVEFLESHLVPTTIVYPQALTHDGIRTMRDWTTYLLPKLTEKGIVDFIEEVGEAA